MAVCSLFAASEERHLRRATPAPFTTPTSAMPVRSQPLAAKVRAACCLVTQAAQAGSRGLAPVTRLYCHHWRGHCASQAPRGLGLLAISPPLRSLSEQAANVVSAVSLPA